MERTVYKPLPMARMGAGAAYQPPPGVFPPQPIKADSPAIAAMTDLRRIAAATITASATLTQANQAMISRSVRLLLVLGADGQVEGLITARDTLGEKPIKMLSENGGRHGELCVADLMVPHSAIEVFDIATVQRAEVGHIVATLKEVGRQHALVVERDAASGKEMVIGVFSATQIGRQLGVPVLTFEIAKTFVQIKAELEK
ncbi:CBS domain protein [mine drainage metagenome]|uniref:CBS domain protein n=1 Tax=mine drainage metagenome TaxID=410659 RepID=A0A1J5SQL0_9ZZZZ